MKEDQFQKTERNLKGYQTWKWHARRPPPINCVSPQPFHTTEKRNCGRHCLGQREDFRRLGKTLENEKFYLLKALAFPRRSFGERWGLPPFLVFTSCAALKGQGLLIVTVRGNQCGSNV